ncbi:MAG TPA: hypothetical protein VEC16_04700 [Alphaproteobacteria bacterium]|nr:hypothetical protein [Alphaproteobacteria bacterium]
MKKREEKKKNWGAIAIALFFIFSMVIGIFAVVLDNGGVPNYNGYSFKVANVDGGIVYKTKINKEYMDFYYYPGDLEIIKLDPQITNQLRQMTGLGLVFNPYQNNTYDLAYIDLIRYELQTQLDKTVYFGITNQSDIYTTLPVVNCSIATAQFPLIIIDTNVNYTAGVDTFKISKENPNCIILNAKLRDLIAAKDRLVYAYYGVME